MKGLPTVLMSVGLLLIAGEVNTTAQPLTSQPVISAPATLNNVKVVIYTNEGQITVELDRKHTPLTTENFLYYVKNGFYNNTLFHRVIRGFMIQGGGFSLNLKEKKTDLPIQNEGRKCGKNIRGAIATARTSDPHSATSQFFINVANNSFLDFQTETQQGWGYCAFGRVVEGMGVVDKISSVATENRDGYQDVPVNNMVILKMEVLSS